jgi:UPF0042 nucleotide-binding protein
VSVHRLVVITGLSGSGKSLAAKCFEDLGYFCVDNLPAGLIPPFSELIQRGADKFPLAALVIDARERGFLDQVPPMLGELRRTDIPLEVLFFECSDDVLKRRFSETRRPHPMIARSGTLEQAIQAEREALVPLRDISDRVIDTSAYTSHQLRAFLTNAYGGAADSASPSVNVESFGFKYGVPAQVDLLFDVRFLPNPYFVDELRHKDGRSKEVQEFLAQTELPAQFMGRLEDFLDFLIPLYTAEGKAYLTVAIGCTGGKHRSVALSEKLGEYLERKGLPHSVNHRDVGKE